MHGAFKMRAENIARRQLNPPTCEDFHPHPHPQYAFADVPPTEVDLSNDGLRFRTIMVANIPPQLRDEKELREYFQYYMSRKLEKPAMGVNSTTQPGFINKSLAFIFNHAKHIPHLTHSKDEGSQPSNMRPNPDDVPVIERVVIARKMTELASLLERREEILRQLESAHIKLAKKALAAVKRAMELKEANKPFKFSRRGSRAALIAKQRKTNADIESGDPSQGGVLSEEERMEQLIKVLGPFVEEFGLLNLAGKEGNSSLGNYAFKRLRAEGSQDGDGETELSPTAYSPGSRRQKQQKKTVWDALLSVPRSSLDPYQPLVNLSHLFRGKTVPSIDYYTAKLNLLTSLITENRAKPVNKYDPVSTAFVTFAKAEDARRACNYLAVHPHNPLQCMVTMAPQYQDLDWQRVMKSSFNAEFVKDWVVSLGVWAFTLFWLFPVSLLVGLVSIQNISAFWPGLKAYLDKHPWEEEVIQSFLPTILVALLALLIPLILLLIAKKAHTITTLSALHDRIMTRYYKFLIVNVLVFFCVGTAALQSVLDSFRAKTSTPDILGIVGTSFPSAGPFYVGWLIFTLAMHGGFEIALLGLPLIMYPTTRRQITPRKRSVGIRPRTFNYYYWLPTHLLVIHVLLLFSVLNPFVLPFGCIYFFVENGVVKNQLIHVYAKNYEMNGQVLLIRMIRYSMDGLILSQAVFLAYMVVLKKEVNVGLAAFLIAFTAVVKIFITRTCRAQFERDDIAEAEVVCGRSSPVAGEEDSDHIIENQTDEQEDAQRGLVVNSLANNSKGTWRLPEWVSFSYATIRHRPSHPQQRHPNPFRVDKSSLTRIKSLPTTALGPFVSLDPNSHEVVVPSEVPPHINTNAPSQSEDDIGPVSVHPPPTSWDDQTTIDLPYDNPYYTRTINNVLWLPRGPCGVLDLDDTVDLKIAISVDPAAGQIGTWLGVPETSTPSQSSLTSSPSTPFNEPAHISFVNLPFTSEPEEVDGTETIDLPAVLAKRAEAGDDVENAARPRRPSTFRRRPSTAGGSNASRNSGARPSTSASARGTVFSYRSFSDTLRPPGRTKSLMSAFDQPLNLERSRSAMDELGQRPDVHAQGDLVLNAPSVSRISLERPQRAQNISTNRAIYHEVLAEERLALQNRIEEEQAEADKTRTQKSWLTSWMFKRAE
uniref:DUF221-domain-containing protein n=2 Tax=Moniliophthora roreri TaxID=221103 RepID=A0A0W0G127_MONRR